MWEEVLAEIPKVGQVLVLEYVQRPFGGATAKRTPMYRVFHGLTKLRARIDVVREQFLASDVCQSVVICHWKVRNSASLLKSRSLAVITRMPSRPALMAISASLVKRPCPVFS